LISRETGTRLSTLITRILHRSPGVLFEPERIYDSHSLPFNGELCLKVRRNEDLSDETVSAESYYRKPQCYACVTDKSFYLFAGTRREHVSAQEEQVRFKIAPRSVLVLGEELKKERATRWPSGKAHNAQSSGRCTHSCVSALPGDARRPSSFATLPRSSVLYPHARHP
jgi:hypothetical protein